MAAREAAADAGEEDFRASVGGVLPENRSTLGVLIPSKFAIASLSVAELAASSLVRRGDVREDISVGRPSRPRTC